MIDYKEYFSKNVLIEILNDTKFYEMKYNFKRINGMDIMKIRGAYIDRLGYFHCSLDLPYTHFILDHWNGYQNLYKICGIDDVLIEIYTIKKSLCTIFTYSFLNKEVILAKGYTDIDNPLKIFQEGLPLLQFGKDIYIKSDEVPIAKFALLDSESRMLISDYRINKYHGCKLHHHSGHDAQIFYVDEYGFSTNEIKFIT
jgi:hypothetical protein